MNTPSKQKILLALQCGFLSTFSFVLLACSPTSVVAPEAALGGASMAVAGGFIGEYLKDEFRLVNAVTPIGVGVGALAGTALGAHYYETKREEAQETLPPVRKPLKTRSGRLDTAEHSLRSVQNRSKWGEGETSSWEDRYWEYEEDTPYQGSY